MKNYISQIKKLGKEGFFHILLGGSLTKIIAFMSSILIVRLLSKDEYAYLAYADNIYSYVLLLCGLGCSSAILKYCISENQNKNFAYFKFAIKFGTISQIVIMIIIVAIITNVDIAFPEAKGYIYSLLFFPFLYFWIGAIQSYMRSLFKNKEFAYSGIIQSGVVLVCSVIFVLIWGSYGVVCARYIALIVVAVYGIKIIQKELRIQDRNAIHLEKSEKKAFIGLGLALLFANLFSMIMPNNESFLINNILQQAHITAEYKVASLIPTQLPFFTSAIVTYYFPVFAKMENSSLIWEKMKRVGFLTGGLILGVTLIGILVSPIIIKIFYGEQYNNIFTLMTFLWIINAINAGFRMLPMNILPAIGYAKFNLVVAFVSCIIHFGIDYFLITYLGIRGAVIAGGFVYFFSGIAYWGYLRYKLCSSTTRNVFH